MSRRRTARAPVSCSQPQGLVVSPDGKTLYVSSPSASTISVFDRSSDGSIQQKPDDAGCIADTRPECRDARSLSSPYNIAISPDGKNLYSAAYSGSAVTAMNIASDGTLNQTTDGATGKGCLAAAATADCAAHRASQRPVLPHGQPGQQDDLHGWLQRRVGRGDPARPGERPDERDHGQPGLRRQLRRRRTAPPWPRSAASAISRSTPSELGSTRPPRVAGSWSSTELPTARSSGTPGRLGAFPPGSLADCTQTRGLTTGNGIAFSPDREHAYVAGSRGLTEHTIDAGGGLVPRPGVTACADERGGSPTAGPEPACRAPTASPCRRTAASSTPRTSTAAACRCSSATRQARCAVRRTVTVQAGSVGALPFPCSDIDGDAFDVSIDQPADARQPRRDRQRRDARSSTRRRRARTAPRRSRSRPRIPVARS